METVLELRVVHNHPGNKLFWGRVDEKRMDSFVAVEAECRKVLHTVIGAIKVDVVKVKNFFAKFGAADDATHFISSPRRHPSLSVVVFDVVDTSSHSGCSLMAPSTTFGSIGCLSACFVIGSKSVFLAHSSGKRVIDLLVALIANTKSFLLSSFHCLSFGKLVKTFRAVFVPCLGKVSTSKTFSSKPSKGGVDGVVMKTKASSGFSPRASFFVGLLDQIKIGRGSSRHGRSFLMNTHMNKEG